MILLQEYDFYMRTLGTVTDVVAYEPVSYTHLDVYKRQMER